VGDLEHTAAVRLYADAIGRALALSRQELAIVRDASTFMRERQLMPRTGELSDLSDAHRLGIVEAVLFHREHWDSPDGTPGSVGGEMIPLSSRILAVADAWAGLTAKGSPGLSHAQVLNQLEERAGMHFDPQVVSAARSVVAEQRLGGLGAVAYQPRLGRVSTASAAYNLMAPQPEPAQSS
jgi:HD-GYP domain-containing protein (c-di-GMP phosphodiesterase class II)